jgi:alkylhydroperoxidase/carboxymuconolactone decarboxylase family protein YurZ
MPTINPIDESKATGKVKEIFAEIKSVLKLPQVPTLYRLMAHMPEYLDATWQRTRFTLYDDAHLDVRTKRMLSLAVSATNNDQYMIIENTNCLKALGVTDAEIAEVMTVVDVTNGLNKFVKGFQIQPGT